MYPRKEFGPSGGIPKERISKFQGNADKYLKLLECSICKNILFIPRECSQCKSKVCLSCLEIYDDMKEKLPQQSAHTRVPQELILQNCPGNASCMGGQFNEVVDPVQMEFMFSLLEFKCHNEKCKDPPLKYSDLTTHKCNFDEFQCKATDCSIKFYRNDDHESKCKKVPLECEYRANGCELTIIRGNMEIHKKECDFQFLICDKCGLPDILKKDIRRHMEDCPKENIICERCNTILLREELKMHNCSHYMTQQISLMQESIGRIQQHEKTLEDKQALIDDKLERTEKREIDLENANMVYLRNSEELLMRMKSIEERENVIDQRSQVMEEKHEELKQKMINIEDKERTLETQIHTQNREIIRIKMKEIEDREISQMNNIQERLNEFEQITSTQYAEIRDRITELDEREHKKDIELQKLNKKTKEFEEKSNEIKNFDGYVSASYDKSLIFMDQEMRVISKYQSPKAKEYVLVIQLRDRRIAASNSNGSIEIIDPITHKLLFTLTGHKDGDSIWGLIELNNGNLVSGSNDKSIKIWDLENKSCVKTLIGHSGNVISFLEHSSGKLISGGGFNDLTSRVWDVVSGECTNILTYDGRIWDMKELPNGEVLSICDSKSKSTLRIWDPQTGHIIGYIESQYQWLTGCRMNESTLFLGGEDGWVMEFNLNSLQFGKKFKLHDSSVCQLFKVSDILLISASGDNKVKMFNMDDGKIVHTMKQHYDPVRSFIGLQLKV